jgi:hypothetical protein
MTIKFSVLCGTASVIFAQKIPESLEDHESEHKKRLLHHTETTNFRLVWKLYFSSDSYFSKRKKN